MPTVNQPLSARAIFEELEGRILLAAAFQDVTASLGLPTSLPSRYLHGSAWGDVNNDGYPDLFYGTFGAAEGPDRLYINNGGTGFTESVQASINVTNGRCSGAVFADLDNDGDLDLIIMNNYRTGANNGLNRLLANDGLGNFTDVTVGSGINQANMSGRNAFVLDYDGDGDLDVILQNDMWGTTNYRKSKLMRNDGNLRFTDVTSVAGLPADELGLVGLGGAVGDINGDGWPDFLSVGSYNLRSPVPAGQRCKPRIRLFINNRNGTFHEATNFNFSVTFPWYNNDEDWPAAASIGDLNGDGLMDLVIGAHYGSSGYGLQRMSVRAYLNQGANAQSDPSWQDITDISGLSKIYAKQPCADIQDFDNDGKMDIWIGITMNDASNVPQPYVYTNTGNVGGIPQFAPPAGVDPPTTFEGYDAVTRDPRNPRYYPGAPTADFDLDGKLDIFGEEAFNVSHYSTVYQNTTAEAGNYLDVRVDTTDALANRNGVGAHVTIYQAGHAGDANYRLGTALIEVGNGFTAGRPAVAHFGVPDASRVDVVVAMPSGGPVYTRTNVPTNAILTVPSGQVSNNPPAAVIISGATTGDVPLTVDFDSSASTDIDGTIVSYAWDFGDGATASGVTAGHTFTSGGTFTVTLTVTDDQGAPGTATVQVTAIPNLPPTPVISANQTEGEAPLTVNFDASGSSDDGTIVSYVWDFGDGVTASGVTASHTYSIGAFTATLTVTDNKGVSATASVIIRVSVPADNVTPTAAIRTSTSYGAAPLNVTLDATASVDPDGTLSAYLWDFGDGTTGTGATAVHQYTTMNTFHVTLTVLDNWATPSVPATADIVVWPPNYFGSDSRPPYVLAAQINRQAAQRSRICSVSLEFNEDVFSSLSVADLALTNAAGQAVSLAGAVLVRQSTSMTTVLDLSAVTLPDDNYALTLRAAGITDTAGNLLDGNQDGTGGDNYTLRFHKLAGDFNGDRAVNVGDLGLFAAYAGQTGNWWQLPADANADGSVDGTDLAILAGRFGASLPNVQAPAVQATLSLPATAPGGSAPASVGGAPQVGAAALPPSVGDPPAGGQAAVAAPTILALFMPAAWNNPAAPLATVIGAEAADGTTAGDGTTDLLAGPGIAGWL